MVDKSRRFKLEYEDASTGTTTIAETEQETGALQMSRFVHIRKTNDPDILKVWLEGDNFGQSIPTQLGDFATAQNNENEPEILLKQFDPGSSSFVTQGRFYAKNSGTINEKGELALKLYSFMRYTGEQSVDTPTVNTDIEEALNEVLPPGYVADVPAGVTPPSVSNYSLNTRREKGYRELTRDYNYSLRFTSELDGNNDYLVKFEPVGQGGTVDTISQDDVTDGNDAVRFKSWQKDKSESIVNKVQVEGTNSSGVKVTDTVVNQVQIDNFGEKFRKFKIGYIEDSLDSANIAPSYLVPGKEEVSIVGVDTGTNTFSISGDETSRIPSGDNVIVRNSTGNDGIYTVSSSSYDGVNDETDITVNENVSDATADGVIAISIAKVPESGTLKTEVYSDSVVNDSFAIIDNQRNIDDTYTCVQQRNYWPEGASELEFEFEQEGLEREAQKSENLRDERARLYPSSTTDVGGQIIDQSQSNTTTAQADNATQEDDQDPAVGGNTGVSGPNSFIDDADEARNIGTSAITGSFQEIADITANVGANGGAGLMIYCTLNTLTTENEIFRVEYKVEQNGTDITNTGGSIYPQSIYMDEGTFGFTDVSIWLPVLLEDNDNIKVYARSADGSSTGGGDWQTQVFSIEKHSHAGFADGGSLRSALHTHNVQVNDGGHGAPTDPSEHELQGQTETGQNINVASEDDTSR